MIELLLALSLGIGLSGMMLQLLINESSLGLRVNRLWRERSLQHRTLELIRSDVQRASRISTTPQLEQHACSLAGRLPVLHLTTAAGTVTYSVGAAPSAIWRGHVLMRCGPAFDVAGKPSETGTAQNRVVIDALAIHPEPWADETRLIAQSGVAMKDLAGSSATAFSAMLAPDGGRIVALRLQRTFATHEMKEQLLTSEVLIGEST